MLNVREKPGGGVLMGIKAVPGASRDQIVGVLGDRLKVRVAAPPEDGQANRAICELIAGELGLKRRDVEVVEGLTSAEKTLSLMGVTADDLRRRWP